MTNKALIYDDIHTLLNKASASGHSVFDHISEVVSLLASENPSDSYELFELFSEIAKSQKETKHIRNSNVKLTNVKNFDLQKKWLRSISLSINRMGEYDSGLHIRDFVAENRLLNSVGLGFSEREAYSILLSIRRLANSITSVRNLRFWGKIFGLENDYLIAEGEAEVGETRYSVTESTYDNCDPRGVGPNRHIYWVQKDTFSDWIMLPDVQFSHIAVTRNLKKILTGNLESHVLSYPWFPGDEKHFLRAIIAIISSETIVCPNGLWKYRDDDTGAVEEDIDFEMPPLNVLKSISSWSHCREYLNLDGKSSLSKLINGSERTLKSQENQLLDTLRLIADDKSEDEEECFWVARLIGDTRLQQDFSHGYVLLRNQRWPGSFTVTEEGNFVNVYIGFGFDIFSSPFFPVVPDNLQKDPDDLEEQPEPQPEDDILSSGRSEDESEINEDEDNEQTTEGNDTK